MTLQSRGSNRWSVKSEFQTSGSCIVCSRERWHVRQHSALVCFVTSLVVSVWPKASLLDDHVQCCYSRWNAVLMGPGHSTCSGSGAGRFHLRLDAWSTERQTARLTWHRSILLADVSSCTLLFEIIIIYSIGSERQSVVFKVFAMYTWNDEI